jgi:hypothetical protein
MAVNLAPVLTTILQPGGLFAGSLICSDQLMGFRQSSAHLLLIGITKTSSKAKANPRR